MKSRNTQRLHRLAFGRATVLHNPAGAFDDEMEGDGDDEEDPREREILEGLLRELRESSDDEMPDIFSPLPTPPMSETGGDSEEEVRPIDGGHVGLDEDMDNDTGLIAKDLDQDNVRHKMVDWLAGAATGMLVSSFLLCVWFSV